MTTFDLTPLFRSTVGFDRMADLLDAAMSLDDGPSTYPPYNIEKHSDERYRIVMAVAGFKEEDLTITMQENLLVITGQTHLNHQDITYVHRGIAGRAFERRFQLADSIKVLGASLESGLLTVYLMREVSESQKPRSIPIERRTPEYINSKETKKVALAAKER
jgi:molecular chaperone IbpA